jgi:hypothetical protein
MLFSLFSDISRTAEISLQCYLCTSEEPNRGGDDMVLTILEMISSSAASSSSQILKTWASKINGMILWAESLVLEENPDRCLITAKWRWPLMIMNLLQSSQRVALKRSVMPVFEQESNKEWEKGLSTLKDARHAAMYKFCIRNLWWLGALNYTWRFSQDCHGLIISMRWVLIE